MFIHKLGIGSAEAFLEPAQFRRARRDQKLRSVGWVGVLAGLGLFVAASLASLSADPVLSIAALLLVASLALIGWTRIWVRESREPFKYTFSVEPFEPGPGTERALAPGSGEGPLAWLDRDLTEKLSKRVARLSIREEGDVPRDEGDQDPASHVHISGWVGLRHNEDGELFVEVVPRVRLGGRGAASKLARTIHFDLVEGTAGVASDSAAAAPGGEGDRITHVQYRRLFERVYWSVASEIYAQIAAGVERKVLLLPPGLRATAYLHEADDYASSNTIDAYDQARDLYRRAHLKYDRGARPRPASQPRQALRDAAVVLDRVRSWLRRRSAKAVRRAARRDVLAARAQLGYARMLVSSWHLKRLSGSVPTAELYGAPASTEEAVERLERLPDDVPERTETVFRGKVILAIADHDLGNRGGAIEALAEAERIWPVRSATDPEFLLAAGMLEGRQIAALRLFAGSVERDPGQVRARFHRAQRLEELWRRRPRFERDVAAEVDDAYAKVIAYDPGNVSAWANRGYIAWLLSTADPAREEGGDGDGREAGEGDRRDGRGSRRPSWRQRSESALRAGREYKRVRAETMVAELDWNLARHAAERDEFPLAYSRYIDAVSAMIATPNLGFVDYFYKFATEGLVARFDAYAERVRELAERRPPAPGGGLDRTTRSVLAFALNDAGAAHHALFRRCGESDHRERARRLFEEAEWTNRDFVLPKYNLAELYNELATDRDRPEAERGEALERARHYVDEVQHLERDWIFARILAVRVELGQGGFDGSERRRCLAFAERQLSPLLPHRALRDGGPDSGLCRDEAAIAELSRDTELNWKAEMHEVHVYALSLWARAVAHEHPEAAAALYEVLRENHYRGHPQIASILVAASTRRVETQPTPGNEARRDECFELARELTVAHLEAALDRDPVDLDNLRRVDALDPERRRRALRAALESDPGRATREWVEGKETALGAG